MRHRIVVLSGKGGVGKTTIIVNLAVLLQKRGSEAHSTVLPHFTAPSRWGGFWRVPGSGMSLSYRPSFRICHKYGILSRCNRNMAPHPLLLRKY
ncbi:MAG: P-loop NTPase [Candidatus Zixiibacteriota bacterium]